MSTVIEVSRSYHMGHDDPRLFIAIKRIEKDDLGLTVAQSVLSSVTGEWLHNSTTAIPPECFFEVKV